MKKPASSSPFKQFADSLQISTQAVYAGLVLIVGLTGLALALTSMNQTQNPLTQADTSYETIGCNEPCEHNHQCQANHFCYQGRCRLADNPLSPTCDAGEIIPTATPKPKTIVVTATSTPAPKKGDEVTLPTLTPTTTPTTAPTTEPTAEPTSEATKSASLSATTTPEPILEPLDEEEPPSPFLTSLLNFLSGINQGFNQLLENLNLSLPIVLGIGAAGLVLLIAFVSSLNKRKEPKFKPEDFTNLGEKRFEPPQPSSEKTKSGSKITKTPQTISAIEKPKTSKGTASAKPSQPPQPQTPKKPAPMPKPPKPASSHPSQSSKPETAVAENDQTPPPSSMIHRMKEKGVEKPGEDN